MEILSLSTQWHVDGTFKSAPHLFAQNYLIHGWLNSVTILMPDGQKITYKKMIKKLKQAITLILNLNFYQKYFIKIFYHKIFLNKNYFIIFNFILYFYNTVIACL